MPDLGAILTAIVTPFDDCHRRVDEEAFVALHRHVCAARLGRRRGVRHHRRGVDAQRRRAPARHRARGEREAAGARRSSPAPARTTPAHAVEMTEKATALGVDAILSVTPYYNRPPRRGIVEHFKAVAAATDKPIILYNIPQRTGVDMPNDLLAELAQIDGIEGVKQANADNLALVDGLDLYAGNDDLLADVLDLGGAGGILTASHLVGDEMRRMVDASPDERARDRGRPAAALRGAGRLARRDAHQGRARAARRHARACPRLPYVTLDEDETRRAARRARAPRPAGAGAHVERNTARPAARRAGRDRQEHDRRRVRRLDRRRRLRPAVPDRRDARRRPRPAGLHLPARARRRRRGDRHHPRARGPRRRAAVGPARGLGPATSRTRRRSTGASSRWRWPARGWTSTSCARSSSRTSTPASSSRPARSRSSSST